MRTSRRTSNPQCGRRHVSSSRLQFNCAGRLCRSLMYLSIGGKSAAGSNKVKHTMAVSYFERWLRTLWLDHCLLQRDARRSLCAKAGRWMIRPARRKSRSTLVALLLKSLSAVVGRSQCHSFIATHHLDVNEIEKPLDQYNTFNEFFYRKLKPGARSCAAPNDPLGWIVPTHFTVLTALCACAVAVSPADCRLSVRCCSLRTRETSGDDLCSAVLSAPRCSTRFRTPRTCGSRVSAST